MNEDLYQGPEDENFELVLEAGDSDCIELYCRGLRDYGGRH